MDFNESKNINILPTEIMCRIFSVLPQHEMVRNRIVSRYWRDTIDNHCTLDVEIVENDPYLDRKFQLRMIKCTVVDLPKDCCVKFTYPQNVRFIDMCAKLDVNKKCRLLSQVYTHLHSLQIAMSDNIFTYCPINFPLARKLTIKMNWNFPSEFESNNLESIFTRSSPLLDSLVLDFSPCDPLLTTTIFKGTFNLLANHRQKIKHFDLYVHQKGFKELLEARPLGSEILELEKLEKQLISKGGVQFEKLNLHLPGKYFFCWKLLLQNQKRLTNLCISETFSWSFRFKFGIPFIELLPVIENNFNTLCKLYLHNILSVDSDSVTWIPFNCSVLSVAKKLVEISLWRNVSHFKDNITPKPNKDEGAPITYLDQLPLSCLKKLDIYDFVCDTRELQSLVDAAPTLNRLNLGRIKAPSKSERFNLTGANDYIIQSFRQKSNTNVINVT